MAVFKEKDGNHCIKSAIYDAGNHSVLLEFFCNEGFLVPLDAETEVSNESLTNLVGYWVRMHGTNDEVKIDIIIPDDQQ